MNGLPPEDYGITLEDIGIVIAYAKRDSHNSRAEVRRRFHVSAEQADEWIKEAYRAKVIPDHSRLRSAV
jgi:hypothetical protein